MAPTGRRPTPAEYEARVAEFWDRVDQTAGPEGCWPWTGPFHPAGYGQITINGMPRAHRIAWTLVNGLIPVGMQIRHTCDNRPCCNPAHLVVGTNRDNVDDRTARGLYVPPSRDHRTAPRGENSLNARLSEAKVRAIRLRCSLGGVTQRTLAREFGVKRQTVSDVIRRITWAHLDP